ncbi:MAG: HAD-IIIC family phosphatase [Bacillota bacterium]
MFDIADLPWLPDAPADFRRLCRELSASDGDVAGKLRRLSGSRFDLGQAGSLTKAIARLEAEGADLSSFMKLKLGVLPSATFDTVAQVLPATGLRHGLLLEIVAAPAEQVHQNAMDPASAINRERPDYVLLAYDHRWLSLDALVLDDAEAADRVTGALGRIEEIAEAVARNSGATVIVPTVPEPADAQFGSFDRRFAGAPRAMVAALNDRLVDAARERGWPLLDVAELASAVGRTNWFDERFFNLYKVPFALRFVPIYADYVCRLLSALRGRSRKCLVLDLDNTCWGGAIGDEGLEGIILGVGSPEGESFLAVQAAAAELKARGIILAVCSKNDDATAREAFRSHPDMLLREQDIAVFNANWEDKASNVEAIARTLSIGLDSLVFFDDNPVERETVRAALPMVAVPELPADPAAFPRILRSAGYFEAAFFSEEDRNRSASYAANAQRAEVFAKARDIGDYLQSLEMELVASRFDELGRDRVTQLINKSNQFNLTSKRYTRAEVMEFEKGDGAALYFRLRDRFGDFGIIGVVICTRSSGSEWEIDSWLMSCRVLGRRVEEAMLAEVVRVARERGVERLTATFIPTAKNKMVAEHYDTLGFSLLTEREDRSKRYALDLADYRGAELPLKTVPSS